VVAFSFGMVAEWMGDSVSVEATTLVSLDLSTRDGWVAARSGLRERLRGSRDDDGVNDCACRSGVRDVMREKRNACSSLARCVAFCLVGKGDGGFDLQSFCDSLRRV